MLFATILLMSQLCVSDGLPEQQGRTSRVAQAQSDKPQTASPAARSGRGRGARSQSTPDELRVFHFKHIQCHRAAGQRARPAGAGGLPPAGRDKTLIPG